MTTVQSGIRTIQNYVGGEWVAKGFKIK